MSPVSSSLIGKPVTLGWENGIHKLNEARHEISYSGWYWMNIAECGVHARWAYAISRDTHKRVVCKTCWPNGIPPKLQYRGTDRTYVWKVGAKTQHILFENNVSYCGLSFYESLSSIKKSKKQVASLKLCQNCDPTLKLGNIWRQLNKL